MLSRMFFIGHSRVGSGFRGGYALVDWMYAKLASLSGSIVAVSFMFYNSDWTQVHQAAAAVPMAFVFCGSSQRTLGGALPGDES